MKKRLWAHERQAAKGYRPEVRARAVRFSGSSRYFACGSLLLAALTFAGCGHIEPWVKPYERSAFADPIMAADRNPASAAYIDHVHEVREAARGASGSAGGGCGCN